MGVGYGSARKNCPRDDSAGPEPRAGEIKVVLSPEELAMLLGGIDLSQARHRPWYRSQMDNDEVGADRINTA